MIGKKCVAVCVVWRRSPSRNATLERARGRVARSLQPNVWPFPCITNVVLTVLILLLILFFLEHIFLTIKQRRHSHASTERLPSICTPSLMLVKADDDIYPRLHCGAGNMSVVQSLPHV